MNIIHQGTHDGIEWAVAVGPASINGYVQLPDSYPFTDPAFILDDVVTIHGGITGGVEDWIGFDTAHSFDRWSDEDVMKYGFWQSSIKGDGRLWTVPDVVEEAKHLATQVAALANHGAIGFDCTNKSCRVVRFFAWVTNYHPDAFCPSCSSEALS